MVDPDFSATRDRSESQSGFSDPAEDSVKTLLDLDSLMEQEEILREAEAGRNCCELHVFSSLSLKSSL